MTTKDAIDLAEYAVVISRLPACKDASAFSICTTVAKLARLGREARNHAENMCHFPMLPTTDEMRRASITKRARQALRDLFGSAGVDGKISVHGDPRRWCLEIEIIGSSALRF